MIPWLAAFLPTGGGWRSAAAAISELHGTSTTCVVPGGDRGHGGNEGDKDLRLVEQTGVTRNQQVHPQGTYGPDMTVTDDIVVHRHQHSHRRLRRANEAAHQR